VTQAGRDGTAPLTVCTVVYDDARFLEAHQRLAARLNPSATLDWLVVSNRPGEPLELAEVPGVDARVIPGAPETGDPTGGKRGRSWHHAAGLERAMPELRSRFVLICDADCMLVRPRWADVVVDHMRSREIALFGVPYHPRQPIKMRDVPCAVALFVDTSRVDLTSLDWRPSAAAPRARARHERLIAALLPRIGEGDRLTIGCSEDTGIVVYRRAHEEKRLRYEAVTPVLLPHQLIPHVAQIRRLALDRVLPDAFSYVPKRSGAWAEHGFVPELADFEEYVWQGRPFAFHLRPTRKHADRDTIDLDALTARFAA
jgi:hypothetical protein